MYFVNLIGWLPRWGSWLYVSPPKAHVTQIYNRVRCLNRGMSYAPCACVVKPPLPGAHGDRSRVVPVPNNSPNSGYHSQHTDKERLAHRVNQGFKGVQCVKPTREGIVTKLGFETVCNSVIAILAKSHLLWIVETLCISGFGITTSRH